MRVLGACLEQAYGQFPARMKSEFKISFLRKHLNFSQYYSLLLKNPYQAFQYSLHINESNYSSCLCTEQLLRLLRKNLSLIYSGLNPVAAVEDIVTCMRLVTEQDLGVSHQRGLFLLTRAVIMGRKWLSWCEHVISSLDSSRCMVHFKPQSYRQ